MSTGLSPEDRTALYLARRTAFAQKFKAATSAVLASLVSLDLTAEESLHVLFLVRREIENQQKKQANKMRVSKVEIDVLSSFSLFSAPVRES